uniref:Uncharacterized protein n=1 Tax=Oryza punctata TaxID=4537 RepID=A0A0E0LE07_ORYPU
MQQKQQYNGTAARGMEIRGQGHHGPQGSEGAPNGCQMFSPQFLATYHGTPSVKPRQTPCPPNP